MDGGLWHYRGDRDQDHPQDKERKNGCLKRTYKPLWKEVKGKGEKKYISIWMQSSKEIARRDKKAFLSDQGKQIDGKK